MAISELSLVHHSKPSFNIKKIESIYKEILQSNRLVNGKFTNLFEKNLCDLVNKKYCCGTNSGSSAVHLALLIADVKSGDKVGMPSYICSSVLNPIEYIGAEPVLIDSESTFFAPSYEEIKKSISEKNIKVLIYPHLFGFAGNIAQIKSDFPDIILIEDCAQCFGNDFNGIPIGSFGDITVFSFYVTKILSGGRGGAICVNSKLFYEKLCDYLNFDNRIDYKPRYNYGITELQAGMIYSQMNEFLEFINIRRKIAARYDEYNMKFKFEYPYLKNSFPIYFRYILQIFNEEVFKKIFRIFSENKIEVKKPVFRPLHRYFNFSGFNETEKWYKSFLSVPIYPALADNEIDRILKIIKFINQNYDNDLE